MTMPKLPKIALIILNWNGLSDTKECLQSVIKNDYPNYSLYIIDNASTNDELKEIKSFLKKKLSTLDPRPSTAFFQNTSNLGFAGGNNVGIKQALKDGAEWIYLLNNDTVVEPDFLSAALQASHPHTPNTLNTPSLPTGIVATTMINYYKRTQLDNIGHDLLSNGDTIPRGRGKNCKLVLENWALQQKVVLGACAGAALYSSKMLKEIGLLDEDFFLNYEDSDLSLRAIVRGWHCAWAPESKVYHKLNASIGKIKNAPYRIRSQRNQLWAYLHNIPLPVIILNLPWIVLRDILVIGVSFLTFRWTITKIIILSRWEVLITLPKILKKRHKVLKHKKVSSYWLWKNQKSWFSTYWDYFKLIVLKGNKSVMEKS